MKGLSNNQLKLIALSVMTLDHIGAYLLPHVLWLRIIGRLAFPIFACMIAEGCRHTRSMGRYLATMAGFALLCQTVDFLVRGSLYQSILVTFSLSIGLIWLVQKLEKTRSFLWALLWVAGITAAYGFCEMLPYVLRGTDFAVDYGFIGVMVPVAAYLGKTKAQRLVFLLVALAVLAAGSYYAQWYSLLAVPILALYNGQRGKWNMKWLFYIYYPLHLVAIYGVSYLL